MKRMLFAALIALSGCAPALAADKAGPAPAATVEQTISASEMRPPFHGLHIGAALGHSAGSIRSEDGVSIARDGYTAGVLIGYDHRLANVPGVVVGVEADGAFTDISGATAGDGFTIRGSTKWLATVRGRLGYSFGNSMLYGTAGLAQTNGKVTGSDGAMTASASADRINGFAYGVGLESYVFGNVGIRLEALKIDWRPAGFTSDALDAGKLRSDDTHIRAALIVRQ